jgi:TIR domain
MADIFLSYSTEDQDWAKVVAMALEQSGWSVWWDREIPVGRTWDEVLEEEIANARCIVVLWSPAASDWVKNEARDAKNRRILIPALIEPTRLPMEFRHIQTADLTAWKPGERSVEFEKLLAGLRRLLGQSDEARMAENSRSPEARSEPPPQVGAQLVARASSADEAATGQRVPLPPPAPKPKRTKKTEAIVDYSDRTGVFTGSASNKTYNATGKASLEVFEIENFGRSVSARSGFSEGLYSKGTLVGTIDEEYRLELVGIISSFQSGGSFDCRLRCRFVGLDRIEGEYFLEPRAWNFLSAKQHGELALVRE